MFQYAALQLFYVGDRQFILLFIIYLNFHEDNGTLNLFQNSETSVKRQTTELPLF